jgi:hypothetical protein
MIFSAFSLVIKASAKRLVNALPAINIFRIIEEHNLDVEKVAKDICSGRVEVTLVEFKEVEKSVQKQQIIKDSSLMTLTFLRE